MSTFSILLFFGLIIWSVIVSYNNYKKIQQNSIAIDNLSKYLHNKVIFSVDEEPEVQVQKEALILSNKFVKEFKARFIKERNLDEEEDI